MSVVRTFQLVPGTASIYQVRDGYKHFHNHAGRMIHKPDYDAPIIGHVAKVGYVLSGPWIASDTESFDGPRVAFRTRHEAGEALANYNRTSDRSLIYGDERP